MTRGISSIQRIAGVARLALVGVALALVMWGGPARAQTPDLLRELAERLLMPMFVDPSGIVPRVQLFPGALPPGAPLEVPLPPGGRLVGSALRTNPPPSQDQIDVVVDAPGDVTEVLRFYQEALDRLGWRRPPTVPQREPHGFQPVSETLFGTFCRSERGPWIDLQVVPRGSGPNDVRLSINNFPGPCGDQDGPGAGADGPPGQNLVPLIATPAGARITRNASLSGPGMWASFAVAESTRSAAELEAAIASQLAAAGWTRTDGLPSGVLAWSVWSIPGEGNWQGLLTVLEGPGSDRRTLQIQVTAPELPAPGPGPRGR